MKQTFRQAILVCSVICILAVGCGKKEEATGTQPDPAGEASRRQQYSKQMPDTVKKTYQAGDKK